MRSQKKPLYPAGLNATSAQPTAADSRKKIFVVDDHPMTRAGIVQLINREPDLMVGSEVGDFPGAFMKLAVTAPDLLLAGISLPGGGCLEFIKNVLSQHSQLPILVFSVQDELVYAERALRAGARGYLMKAAGGDKLLAAIRLMLSGRVYVSEQLSAAFLDSLTGRRPRGSSSPIEKLSDREFEVFQLVGQGQSTRDIASYLHLSRKTVDVYRSHIKEKLDLKHPAALLRRAVLWVETQQVTA